MQLLEAILTDEEFSQRVKDGIKRAKLNPKPKKIITPNDQLKLDIRRLRAFLGSSAMTFDRCNNEVRYRRLPLRFFRVFCNPESVADLLEHYRLLLRAERVARRRGIRLSPWRNRKLLEKIIR